MSRDTTRGMSKNRPEDYKRDDLVQVWLDSRHLATLLRWIENSGVIVRFKSEIVRTVIEQVVHHLVDRNEAKMIDTAEQAMDLLKIRFGVDPNPSGRGLKNRKHNLELDGIKAERAGPSPPSHRIHTQTSPDKPAFDVDEAVKIYKKLSGEEVRKNIKEEMEVLMASADIHIDEQGRKVITPRGTPRGIVTEEVKAKIDTEREERDAKEKEEEKEKRKQYKLKVKRDKLLAQLDELDEVVEEKEEDDTPAERSYEDILADRVEKDKIQDDKLSMENDPMLDNKTKDQPASTVEDTASGSCQ